MWAQIARFYAPMLPQLVLAVAMVTFSQQLKQLDADGYCPSFVTVVASRVTPVSVVMPGRLLAAILGTATLSQVVPINDFSRLAQQVRDIESSMFSLHENKWFISSCVCLSHHSLPSLSMDIFVPR